MVAITAAKVGPFDLGTVVIRQALQDRPRNRRSLHRRHRLGPDPPHHQGHPGPPPRHPRLHRPPRIHLQPDRLQADLDRLDGARLRASTSSPKQTTTPSPSPALPGGRLRRPALQAQAHPEAQGRDQARRPPGPPRPPAMNGIGEAAIARAQVTLPRSRVPRERPHRHDLHPGAVQGGRRQRRKVPARLDLRLRQGRHPDALRTPGRPGLPALQPQHAAARPGRRPAQRRDQRRPGRPRRLGQGRRHPQHLRSRPRRPGHLLSTSTWPGGKKGLLVNSTDLCKAKHRVKADFTGQNGKGHVGKPKLRVKCKGKKHRAHRLHRRLGGSR